MPLTINFSDPTKTAITVPDFPPGINAVDTSLALVGKGYPNYGQKFAESFVHLLENFASPTPPENPIEGQLWYDTSDINNKVLKIMDGTASAVRWPNANGIYQQPTDPKTSDTAGLKNGDIWVDTLANQIKIYNQNSWTLIGPCATNLAVDSNGNIIATNTTTGSFPTIEADNQIPPRSHEVIENYVNGKVISIISNDSFTPKKAISGFGINPIIKGINLSTGAIINGMSLVSRYLDISNTANIQFQGTTVIAAGNFLRKEDSSQTGQVITGKINLQNSSAGGLIFSSTVNSETSNILFLENNTIISNSASLGKIILKVNSVDLITVSAEQTQIATDLIVSGKQTVASLTATNDISTLANLNVAGDINNQGKIYSGDDIQVTGQLYCNWNNGQAGPVILPGTASTPRTNTFDIGSPSASFRTVYAKNVGTATTNLYGSLIGTANTASQLTNYTHAQIVGAVTSDEFIFNGDGYLRDVDGLNLGKSIDVQLTSAAIYEQPIKTNGNSTTTSILAYDSTNPTQLFQLVNNIFLPGMMMPYGGNTAPPGWLLCNGVGQSTSDYPNLFSVIQYTYGGSGNSFVLPDMRHSTQAEGISVNYIIKT